MPYFYILIICCSLCDCKELVQFILPKSVKAHRKDDLFDIYLFVDSDVIRNRPCPRSAQTPNSIDS